MEQIRLKFSKYGPVRFVGHLDVMRYFQKVMRRAGVDIAWSEGFSPHPLMHFAQPLSVGATSDGEYLDLSLRSFADLRKGETAAQEASPEHATMKLLERLHAVCREGITVTDAVILPEKAEKAMTAVKACAWRVRFREEALPENASPEALAAGFAAYADRSSLPAAKKTKKGIAEKDLKPSVYAARLADDKRTWELLLESGSENNVKPALLFGAYLRDAHVPCAYIADGCDELSPAALILHRLETYTEKTDETGTWLEPLICRDPAARFLLKRQDASFEK